MKTIASQLQSHFASESPSTALCWTVLKKTGATIRGTDHDRDLTISSGVFAGTYTSMSGISGSNNKTGSDLSVDNTEVDAALAAINTAHNHVSSDISLAQASADQRIVESRRAVEIETLKAQAEVQPLLALADQLQDLKAHGALTAYLRNVRLSLIDNAERIVRQQD